jgi:hypothetical protein
MSTNPKIDLDAEREAAFLRRLAKQLGVDELSDEALAKSLGLDAFTDEKLDDWFVAAMRRWVHDSDEPAPQQASKVVQTDPPRAEAQPVSNRVALPPARRRSRRRP